MLLDACDIIPLPVNPLAGLSTWLLVEPLNVSAYDAGCVFVARSRGLPPMTRDLPLVNKLKRIAYQPS